jgi:hypothetical protein
MNNENSKKNITIFFIVIIVFTGTLFILNTIQRPVKVTNNANPNTVYPSPSPKIKLPPGKLTLQTETKDIANRKLVIIASFDSAGDSITSFDIDIRYNVNKLKVDKIETLVPGFDIHNTNDNKRQDNPSDSELILTGIKATYNNDPAIFKVTKIARITFVTNGNYNNKDIQLVFKPFATDDSNLLNIDSQEILGYVVNPNLE